MTFDDIKEMQIGSKKVKEAWLNGRQVYPRKKRITDSLVCWYDIGKQQCTNESMAANPVLADLSGNGHNIGCFNFGWAGMSGIGGYVFSRPLANWYKPSANNGSYTTEDNVLHITKLNTNSGVYYVTNNGNKTNTIVEITGNNYTTKPFKIKISGLPEGKLVLFKGLVGNNSVSPNISVIYENKYFDNGEHIVESSSVVWDNEELEPNVINYPSILIDSDTADDVDITIELLPEYPNALVSDGVDDYCYTDGLPILTDYTVIAKRKWLQTESDNNDCFAAKGNILASFLVERYGNNGSQEAYSFGQYNGVSFVQEDIIYQTKESYNGYPLKVGTATDGDNLVILGRTSAPLGCIQAALYSFLLFDRTLTTAEIEWVKKNMIESGGVLATNWSDSRIWTFRNSNNADIRINGTITAVKMNITSCLNIKNFMEVSVENITTPAYTIKVTGLKNGITLQYKDADTATYLYFNEDGIYTIPAHNTNGRWYGFSFNKVFENENIVIQQLLSE